MSYKSLFGNAPVAPADTKVGLFGEDKKINQIAAIDAWCKSRNTKTSANRINFILNGFPLEELMSINITDIGAYQVDEATEANKCVDEVVNEFAQLKDKLNDPKQRILGAIKRIEEATKPQSFFKLLRSSKVDWAHVRSWVGSDITTADLDMKATTKYHLDPFIQGLKMARNTLESISKNIEQALDTLDYVIENTKDQDLQDLARRRKEMFSKSKALMDMNISQMHTMSKTCEAAKHFGQELEMTIKPLIENILRTAVINDTDDGASMKEIQSKLKAIL